MELRPRYYGVVWGGLTAVFNCDLEWKAVATLIISGICWLLGGWDLLLQGLVVSVVLDVLMGVLHAYYRGQLSSTLLRQGVMRKFGYFLVLAVGTLLDRTLFNSQPATRTLVAAFFIATECLSVLEHAAGLGVPLPAGIKRKLEGFKADAEISDPTH